MGEYSDHIPDNLVRYPMVPIRDVVVFPYTVVRFKIGRPISVRAMFQALKNDKVIFLAAQHDAAIEEPITSQVFNVGTLARISHHLQLPDGNIKVQFEGIARAKAIKFEEHPDGYWVATVSKKRGVVEPFQDVEDLVHKLAMLVDQYAKQNTDMQAILLTDLQMENPSRFADAIAGRLKIGIDIKQEILELFDLPQRLNRLIDIIDIELEKVQVDKNVQTRVKKQMERANREYYLHEKIKAINKELGRKDEKAELEELKKKIETAGMSQDAHNKAIIELRRLEQMPFMSAESAVSRNYIDWLLAVPWVTQSEDILDLNVAEEILEKDHYGLEKVKERILEFLAVRKLVKIPKGTILCFVGPPGVGKTSLGHSIARAIGRKFVRLSLGGVRDEAEIRGHRRTYVGALPGQIIQMMKKAGTVNPLILLDEIDKLGSDFRGDPSAALLEVLDPEQNNAFQDHYLDVEYDLSKVMFIATANLMHTIPTALQDRLEVVRLSGYTDSEKLEIAKKYLIPKQQENNGIIPEQLKFCDSSISMLIQNYTREAGVRNLEREISSICRKAARKIIDSSESGQFFENITIEQIANYLGPIRFQPHIMEDESEIGLATGLAWTEAGGEILSIETTLMPGKGQLILTGKLGEVMQESARAAISYVRSKAAHLGISTDFYKRYDIHIHVPEGAIPKDGPSAGITITTSIVSALTNTPVKRDVAMTGEITLRGRVLPIGGLKEKLLAAHRVGIRSVIIPKDNEKDLIEIPKEIKSVFTFHLAKNVDSVLQAALVSFSLKEENSEVLWNSEIMKDNQSITPTI